MANKSIPKLCIAVSGKSKSGKDTLFEILNEMADVKRLAMADEIKIINAKFRDVSPEFIEENKSLYRPELIFIGKVGRLIDENTWINKLDKETILNYNTVITDVRFENEVKFLKTLNGVTVHVVRIESDDQTRLDRGADPTIFNDQSETDLDGKLEHFGSVIINNGSMDEFRQQIQELFLETLNDPKLQEKV